MVPSCSLHASPVQVSSNTECDAVLSHLGEGIKGEMSVQTCYRAIVPDFLSMLVGEPLLTRADFNRSIYCEEVVGSGAAETHGALCRNSHLLWWHAIVMLQVHVLELQSHTIKSQKGNLSRVIRKTLESDKVFMRLEDRELSRCGDLNKK